MAKSKNPAQSIYNISNYLKKDTFLPIYFFFGEDQYSIDSAVRLVEEKLAPLIGSELDREVISGKDRSIIEIIDAASAFPYGGGKKVIVVKEFEEIKGDKKKITPYAKNPNPETILIMVKNGSISNLETEPYHTLRGNNFMFEANVLKGEELITWVIKYVGRKGKKISHENASLLVNIVGENRSTIEMQLHKIITFVGDQAEITDEVIRNLSSALKEFTIFDLQNAISVRNRARSFEMAYNLLDKGKEALFIIAMLNKYFSTIARIPEVDRMGLSDAEAARLAGVHPYYYKDYKKASQNYPARKLFIIARAIFKADLSMKSTAVDPKTAITILLTEILL